MPRPPGTPRTRACRLDRAGVAAGGDRTARLPGGGACPSDEATR